MLHTHTSMPMPHTHTHTATLGYLGIESVTAFLASTSRIPFYGVVIIVIKHAILDTNC
jgi:hypothetical protein